jgi:hypothetical protein
VRGRAGVIHQVTAGGEISGTAGGPVGEFQGHTQKLMNQDSYLKVNLASGTAAWNALEPNILDNSEIAEKDKFNYYRTYGESGSDLMGFMDRTNSASAILGLGETPPQVLGDIKANTDLRAGRYQRLVVEHFQNIRSQYIASTLENDKNTVSISMVEMLGKGSLNDITKKLTGDFLSDIGMTFEKAVEVAQKQEKLTLEWAKDITKKGGTATLNEKLALANKKSDLIQKLDDHAFLNRLKEADPALFELTQSNRVGLTEAALKIAGIAQASGDKSTPRMLIERLADPASESTVSAYIHQLSNPNEGLKAVHIRQLMFRVQNNPILARNPRLESAYDVAIKGMVERIKRGGNPKIAAELLKEYKFWSKTNSEAVVLWGQVGIK